MQKTVREREREVAAMYGTQFYPDSNKQILGVLKFSQKR